MNILVIKQTSLGDVLHSTAAIEMIKKNFPQAHLTYLIDKSCCEIITQNPFVDEIITIDIEKFRRSLQQIFRHPLIAIKQACNIWQTTITALRTKQYYYAIDLQGLFRSAIFLYCVKSKYKITKSYFPFLKYYQNKKIHAIDEMKNLLHQIGFVEDSKNPTTINYFFRDNPNPDIVSFCKNLKKNNIPLLVCSPFSRWENKNWPKEYYQQLLKKLSVHSLNIVMSGTKQQSEIVSKWINDFSPSLNPNPKLVLEKANFFNLMGNLSIDDFAYLLRECDLHLSSDSFPMHLASALEKKQIALFAPTRIEKVGPRNKLATILRAKNCRHCYQRHCRRNCIKQISVEKVYREIVTKINLQS